ncbi:MAG: hypothetical protein HY248_04090 [Fimbriimonas ginsengisoli]|nr:hypothetical protein [Fimbriimonas ginsengisoli]
MERKIKFALYSVGDPQAPQVARDVVGRLNQERKAMGKEPYMRFRDWVSLGYYSNAEGELQVIASDVRRAFANRLDFPEGRPPTDVFQSPVLSGIHLVKDFPLLVVVTPSSTNTITIERIGDKVPMMQAVTGVMIPETNVYYASGQLKGMLGGIKGAYDIENLMDTGINFPGPDGKIAFPYEKYKEGVPPIHVGKIIGKGQAYFATLHYTMALLILAVIAGNVGMWLSRKGAK